MQADGIARDERIGHSTSDKTRSERVRQLLTYNLVCVLVTLLAMTASYLRLMVLVLLLVVEVKIACNDHNGIVQRPAATARVEERFGLIQPAIHTGSPERINRTDQHNHSYSTLLSLCRLDIIQSKKTWSGSYGDLSVLFTLVISSKTVVSFIFVFKPHHFLFKQQIKTAVVPPPYPLDYF
jgi:hypothetical protein